MRQNAMYEFGEFIIKVNNTQRGTIFIHPDLFFLWRIEYNLLRIIIKVTSDVLSTISGWMKTETSWFLNSVFV